MRRWLTDDKGRSVTEMEILHGVLRDPDMAGHAFFYLRDPAWTAVAPRADRGTYDESSADGRARLADLKARVRSSGFPVRDYPEPRAIGDLVRADLLALVDRLIPPRGDARRRSSRRGSTQDAYAAWLVGNTIERRTDLVAVDVAVDADGPGAVVSGAPGGGVSTLLAPTPPSAARRHPDELVSLLRRGPARRGVRARAARHLCRALGDEAPAATSRGRVPARCSSRPARRGASCSSSTACT